MSDDTSDYIEHGALRSDLAFGEVVGRFWNEVRLLDPKTEVHVVDPYLLRKGRRDAHTYAANLATLLKPVLKNLTFITFVYHYGENSGVRDAIERSVRLVLDPTTEIRFVRATQFHHRWLVADRSRLALMDLSFNQIGDSLGGVDVVTKEKDRAEYCNVLNQQDPPPAQ